MEQFTKAITTLSRAKINFNVLHGEGKAWSIEIVTNQRIARHQFRDLLDGWDGFVEYNNGVIRIAGTG